MQSRFWISTHPEFEQAAKAKHKLEEENPDKVYQIRKGLGNNGLTFRVVERLKNNEVAVVNESKRKSKRNKKKRATDLSWVGG